MHIKYSIQGLLIYASIIAYILTFLTALIRLRKTSRFFFFAGFVISCFSYGFRCWSVRNVPLQNLFEVFLFLGLIIYPLSIFCKKALKTRGFVFDPLIGAAVLTCSGFIFPEQILPLPPALQGPFWIPHIAANLFAFILITKAAFAALGQIIGIQNKQANMVNFEESAYRLVCAGFPLLTLALVLGCLWTQFALADWWGWNPAQMWSLATWLVFAGYFFYRESFGTKFPRLNSLWIICGFALILIALR